MRLVDIRMLKKWVRVHLKPGSKLRDIISLEDDYLLPEEYLAKLDVWLKLYDVENGAD